MLIKNVTVIDPRDGARADGQDVLIAGDLISRIGPGIMADGAVIDATGKYLLPGFCDMHAHPLVMRDPAASLRLMLAFGITGFRQMSGSTRLLERRRLGTLLPADSPRLLAMPGQILTPLNAGSATAAIATIREQHELGADFIKAGLVGREVFYDAQAQTRRLGIPIAGHLPSGIDVYRASGEGAARDRAPRPGHGPAGLLLLGARSAPAEHPGITAAQAALGQAPVHGDDLRARPGAARH
jgi:hypothetical protein